MNSSAKKENRLVISYLTLRKAIGYLGLTLPFILLFGALLICKEGIQPSISHYYYTGMGDVFVGILFALGVFLFSYRGYERKDDIAGDFAGVCALGIALFPTDECGALHKSLFKCLGENGEFIGYLHFTFAALFLATLAYFSRYLFTKTDLTVEMTERKKQRNCVYKACGYTIFAAIAAIGAVFYFDLNTSSYNPVFWLESLAIVAFSISWLVKGEAILEDETELPAN